MAKRYWMVLLLTLSLGAPAKEAVLAAQDPVLEARMVHITSELRCLVCQNQTIADSHAGLAVDLRNQVLDLLRQGQTDQQILDYMTARYGDFVLYRPPVKGSTMLLWFGPGLLLVLGLGALYLSLRRRSRLPNDAFDADDVDVAKNDAS